MGITQEAFNDVIIFKIYIFQNVITFNYFIQDIEVQGQLVDAFDLLNQFSTYWASYSILNLFILSSMVKDIQTFSTKSMPAMNQYTWNFFTYVEIFSAKVAVVEPSSFIVCLQKIFWLFSIFSHLFQPSIFFSFRLQTYMFFHNHTSFKSVLSLGLRRIIFQRSILRQIFCIFPDYLLALMNIIGLH